MNVDYPLLKGNSKKKKEVNLPFYSHIREEIEIGRVGSNMLGMRVRGDMIKGEEGCIGGCLMCNKSR